MDEQRVGTIDSRGDDRVDGQASTAEDSQRDKSGASQGDNQELRNSGFIIAWVCLIILGIAVEFLGRLFGYENNPTPIFHVWLPQLTASLSVIVGVAGFFALQSGTTRQSTLRRRNGALLIAMAAFMLTSSFAFKPIIPLIFG
jgi:hypothetical protein